MGKSDLTNLLKDPEAFKRTKSEEVLKAETEKLQLKMLRIQQGLFHKKDRAVIVFEGFDAAGKGGAIRKLTEVLDPRSYRVHPIGAPTPAELGQHYLQRFWERLPQPGHIAIFDRSWYGRILVEKVDQLTPKTRIEKSYAEINQFEESLRLDGINVIKIFLAITRDEQFSRFEDRLKDPYKQWKIGIADIEARKKWDDYVKTVDVMLERTSTEQCPWNVIPANSKKTARYETLKLVTSGLKTCEKWIEEAVSSYDQTELKKMLQKLL
jgi:AMP-polyphosphate phosphotransferase